MEKLDDLVERAKYCESQGDYFGCPPKDIIVIAEAFRAQSQRLEKVEAELAALAKQEPIGTLINTFLAKDPMAIAEAKRRGIPTREVFARPVPGTSLSAPDSSTK